MIGQLRGLAALSREQNPGAYGLGSLVTRVAGLDGMETENSLVLAGIRIPVGQACSLVTIPTTLYRLMKVEDADKQSFTPLSKT